MSKSNLKSRIVSLVKERKQPSEIVKILNSEGYKTARGQPIKVSAIQYYKTLAPKVHDGPSLAILRAVVEDERIPTDERLKFVSEWTQL